LYNGIFLSSSSLQLLVIGGITNYRVLAKMFGHNKLQQWIIHLRRRVFIFVVFTPFNIKKANAGLGKYRRRKSRKDCGAIMRLFIANNLLNMPRHSVINTRAPVN